MKKVREWSDQVSVGIWDNCAFTVTLYADKAVARIPYVRWRDNSGNLAYRKVILSAKDEARLRQITKDEIGDDKDYTDAVIWIAWNY